MRRFAVLALLALGACCWAGITTRTCQLRCKTQKDFLAAFEIGTVTLPEDVTVAFAGNAGTQILSLSGEEKLVEAAVKAVADWDKARQMFLVHFAVPAGVSTVSTTPLLRILAGEPGCITQRDVSTGVDWEFRAYAALTVRGSPVTRLSVGAAGSGTRLVVPFLLSAEEEVSIDKTSDGGLEITATDAKTKAFRKAPLSPELKAFEGLRFTVETRKV